MPKSFPPTEIYIHKCSSISICLFWFLTIDKVLTKLSLLRNIHNVFHSWIYMCKVSENVALEIPLWNSRIFQFETVLEQQSSFLVTDLLLDPYTCKGDYQEILSIYFFISSCLKQVAYFIIMLFKLKLILMVTTSQFYLTTAGKLFELMILMGSSYDTTMLKLVWMNCTMNCTIKVEHFSQICVYINDYIISLFNSKYCRFSFTWCVFGLRILFSF